MTASALIELQVRELALVESARVEFGPGLNLLTGETGSGKSLIVDALGLALGGRSSAEQVRQGARRASVEARFQTPEGDLVLARDVGRRGAARIDGRAASPTQLRELGRRLVGIHGQHEHQLLLDPEAQALLLDTCAGALQAREAVGAAHAERAAARARLTDLERTQARGKREEEYLRWQLEELREARLRPDEDQELAAERTVVRHAARLAELVQGALDGLRDEQGLPAATTATRSAAELDGRLGEVANRLESVTEEVADVGAELRRYAEAIDTDPARLEAIEARLAVLDQVKRKFGGSLEAAIVERDRLEGQLGRSEDLASAIAGARRALEEASARLEAAAAELSRLRVAGAGSLGEEVTRQLAGLRLEGAVFSVRLEGRAEIGPDGVEQVEMRFSANPGEAPAPLARVASGGELSRVMLAIRTAAAAADALPTLVFDEVDAGIGGEAAVQVGLRLKQLGRSHQVLVVTHLPQIACFADRHLAVVKETGPHGRNVVSVRPLGSEEERARELARMMGGAVTEKAMARAHELLEEGRQA